MKSYTASLSFFLFSVLRGLLVLLAGLFPLHVYGAVHFADSPNTVVDTRSVGVAAPQWISASQDIFVEFVEVRWASVTDATGYRVFRSRQNDPQQAQAIVSSTTQTFFEDTGADPAVSYFYWVRALREGQQSAFSEHAVGIRLDPRPASPDMLSATQGTFGDRVRLQWGLVGTAERYELFRAPRDVRELAQAMSTSITIGSFDDLSAPVGWTLYYWVASANSLGISEWAGPVRGRAGRSNTWWGDESLNLQMPETYADAVQIELGRRHGVALRPDGTVNAWGNNQFDQISVPGNLAGVAAVAAGFDHNLALRRDGTVIGWGRNDRGQAHGGYAERNVVGISGGGEFSLALRRNGRVSSWGDNSFGQLDIPAHATDVVMVSAGGGHALALRSDGTVVAWGRNDQGQTNVPADLSDVEAVAAGLDFSLALLSNGTVRGWGNNDNGQAPAYFDALGVAPRSMDGVRPRAAPSNVVSIAVGLYHSVLTTSDGAVITLGLPPTQSVPENNSFIAAVAAGDGFSTALRREGLPAGVNVMPMDPKGPLGAKVIFRAMTLATGQLDYQWYRDNVAIVGANRSFLEIAALSAANVGDYTVKVTNADGHLISQPSMLHIGSDVLPSDFFPGYELVGGEWGATPWLGIFSPLHFPWVYLGDLGWVWFAEEVAGNGFYFLDINTGGGWMWTQPEIFPWAFRLDDETWVEY